jgi:hypothetical protein
MLGYPILARKVRYWLERRWRTLWDQWRVEVPLSDALPSDVAD